MSCPVTRAIFLKQFVKKITKALLPINCFICRGSFHWEPSFWRELEIIQKEGRVCEKQANDETGRSASALSGHHRRDGVPGRSDPGSSGDKAARKQHESSHRFQCGENSWNNSPGAFIQTAGNDGEKTEQRRRGLCFRFLQQCPVGFGSRD